MFEFIERLIVGIKSLVLRFNMWYSFYGKYFLNDYLSIIFNFLFVMLFEFVVVVFNLNVIKLELN